MLIADKTLNKVKVYALTKEVRDKVRPVSKTLGASPQTHEPDFPETISNPLKTTDKVSEFE